ncbi:MAG: sulfur carrier protein ThiS [Oscillospiraceae bacterium]|nr:sulfur carrier protein ThiS [Oscillospiraceae bacterium]
MCVNGIQIALERQISLQDFLLKEGYNTSRVAVEKNGGIISKKSFETEMLNDNDKLEIVNFVGGG